MDNKLRVKVGDEEIDVTLDKAAADLLREVDKTRDGGFLVPGVITDTSADFIIGSLKAIDDIYQLDELGDETRSFIIRGLIKEAMAHVNKHMRKDTTFLEAVSQLSKCYQELHDEENKRYATMDFNEILDDLYKMVSAFCKIICMKADKKVGCSHECESCCIGKGLNQVSHGINYIRKIMDDKRISEKGEADEHQN